MFLEIRIAPLVGWVVLRTVDFTVRVPVPPGARVVRAEVVFRTDVVGGFVVRAVPEVVGREVVWTRVVVRDPELLEGARVVLPAEEDPLELDREPDEDDEREPPEKPPDEREPPPKLPFAKASPEVNASVSMMAVKATMILR